MLLRSKTLHEIHVILLNGRQYHQHYFYLFARGFRVNMFLVLHALSIKNVLAM